MAANYITNRKASKDFETLHTFSAGIELVGAEVKSIKNGKGSIEGARCLVRGGECFVVGMYVPAYQEKNTSEEYDPYRTRRVIVTKKEKEQMAYYDDTKGVSLIPKTVYPKRRLVKIDIAAVRRKTPEDRRYDLRKKIEKREAQRGEL